MKGCIIIVSIFVVGLLLGVSIDKLAPLAHSDVGRYTLYALMFSVGIGIGCDKRFMESLKGLDRRIILLPLATIVGSLAGALLLTPLLNGLATKDVMAVASGFGYYSLSSILLTEYRGAEIGTIALMANIIREISTILLAPLMVKAFGKLSLISAAGATSIDTLLPMITKFSGREYIIIAIFHGLVLELAVPILVTFFAGL